MENGKVSLGQHLSEMVGDYFSRKFTEIISVDAKLEEIPLRLTLHDARVYQTLTINFLLLLRTNISVTIAHTCFMRIDMTSKNFPSSMISFLKGVEAVEVVSKSAIGLHETLETKRRDTKHDDVGGDVYEVTCTCTR
jgi:hypothetical protein